MNSLPLRDYVVTIRNGKWERVFPDNPGFKWVPNPAYKDALIMDLAFHPGVVKKAESSEKLSKSPN